MHKNSAKQKEKAVEKFKKFFTKIVFGFVITFGPGGYALADCTSNEVLIDGQCIDGFYDSDGGFHKTDFSITTTPMAANENFTFSLDIDGRMFVDWGDGGLWAQEIRQEDKPEQQYTYKYTTAGTYTIRFSTNNGEYAWAYGGNSTIRFGTLNNDGNTPNKIASISGSLGALFPSKEGCFRTECQPRFSSTFRGATNLTSLPAGLFDGVSGAADYRFQSTFRGCTGLTTLPSGLFGNVSGAAQYMFQSTFGGCTGLTSLPSDLFSGVSGAAIGMFGSTFGSCTSLTSLPYGLFSGVTGTANIMFSGTFSSCTSLTTVPYNLFSRVSGTPGSDMFNGTFSDNTMLNRFILGNGSVVNYIPPEFFGSISGNPSAMENVFYGNTTISSSCPAGTYKNITGYEQYFSGRVSCKVCPYNGTSPAGSTDVSQCTSGSSININWYLDENDSTTYETSSCTVNNTITIPTEPTRGGYTFRGWVLETNE